MIIDSHAHVVVPPESYKFMAELVASRANPSIAITLLLSSEVFKRLPTLKLIIPHGGGAIPYHMGRFRAWSVHKKEAFFHEQLKHLHFDTTTYDKDALDKLGFTGQCLGIRPLDLTFRAAGPAFTIRYVPSGTRGGTVGDYIDGLPAGTTSGPDQTMAF